MFSIKFLLRLLGQGVLDLCCLHLCKDLCLRLDTAAKQESNGACLEVLEFVFVSTLRLVFKCTI